MTNGFLSSRASFLLFSPGSPNRSAAVHWPPLNIYSFLSRPIIELLYLNALTECKAAPRQGWPWQILRAGGKFIRR